ncbi:hypothetical protein NP493_31g05022 [Ridgeia piscesae]|uniref:Dr1-associated corepressor n=1 Tax=Ridgeia piscesae TaxID=27915 RepID=A0AAD9PD69_RIDPI|nr:hypothetical protein NP493_31g05022 [Ridgeia piscesae]
MPSKKKRCNARFPPARIKKIMQKDEDVGKVASPVPIIISRALELFIESLLSKTNEVTTARKAKTLTTSHIKSIILSETTFDFLKDLVTDVPDIQQAEQNGDTVTATTSDLTQPKQRRSEFTVNICHMLQHISSQDNILYTIIHKLLALNTTVFPNFMCEVEYT